MSELSDNIINEKLGEHGSAVKTPSETNAVVQPRYVYMSYSSPVEQSESRRHI